MSLAKMTKLESRDHV